MLVETIGSFLRNSVIVGYDSAIVRQFVFGNIIYVLT